MGSTLATMQTAVKKAVQLYPVNLGTYQDTLVETAVSQAKVFLLGICRWWYDRDGITIPSGAGDGMTDDLETLWYELSRGLAFSALGLAGPAQTALASFDRLLKLFIETNRAG